MKTFWKICSPYYEEGLATNLREHSWQLSGRWKTHPVNSTVGGKGEQDAEIMLTILREGFRVECVMATQVWKPSECYFLQMRKKRSELLLSMVQYKHWDETAFSFSAPYWHLIKTKDVDKQPLISQWLCKERKPNTNWPKHKRKFYGLIWL